MDMPDAKSAHEPEKEHSPQFIPLPTASGRQWQFPQQYHDFLPNSTTQLPHLPKRIVVCAPFPLPTELRSPSPIQSEGGEPEPQTITTKPDEFGLFCVYETYPSVVPDKNQSLDDCCDAPGLASAPSRPGLDAKFQTFCLVPFTRISSCHFLMLLSFSSWTGSTVDQIWNLFLSSNSLSTVFF